jgi:hypothetical protein
MSDAELLAYWQNLLAPAMPEGASVPMLDETVAAMRAPPSTLPAPVAELIHEPEPAAPAATEIIHASAGPPAVKPASKPASKPSLKSLVKSELSHEDRAKAFFDYTTGACVAGPAAHPKGDWPVKSKGIVKREDSMETVIGQRVKLTPFFRDMGFTREGLIDLVKMLTPNRSERSSKEAAKKGRIRRVSLSRLATRQSPR